MPPQTRLRITLLAVVTMYCSWPLPLGAQVSTSDVEAQLLADILSNDRAAIVNACRYVGGGPAAHYRCIENQVKQLRLNPHPPDLTSFPAADRAAMIRACQYVGGGPAAHNRCLDNQVAQLMRDPHPPDLSGFAVTDRDGMLRACQYVGGGPGAYNRCLDNQVEQLRHMPRPPDLSELSVSDRDAIQRACQYVGGGPAAHNKCLENQLSQLRHILGAAGISNQVAPRAQNTDADSAEHEAPDNLSEGPNDVRRVETNVAGRSEGPPTRRVTTPSTPKADRSVTARTLRASDSKDIEPTRETTVGQKLTHDEIGRPALTIPTQTGRSGSNSSDSDSAVGVFVFVCLAAWIVSSVWKSRVESTRRLEAARADARRREADARIRAAAEAQSQAEAQVRAEAARKAQAEADARERERQKREETRAREERARRQRESEKRERQRAEQAQQEKQSQDRERAQASQPIQPDPYAVLGIPPSATPEEIRRAYRNAIAQYHPDKVEQLGPELRQLANEKTKQINQAYQQLTRR